MVELMQSANYIILMRKKWKNKSMSFSGGYNVWQNLVLIYKQ